MENIVNVHEAKTHLSRLIEDVLQGEEVIIARAGKPLIRLTPYEKKRKPIRFGLLSGKATIPDEFNDPLPARVLARFLGTGR